MSIEIENSFIQNTNTLSSEPKKGLDQASHPIKTKLPAEQTLNKDTTLTLQVLHDKVAQTPVVDVNKVELVKNKIARNELDILSSDAKGRDSALRIAAKLLDLEQDLFSGKS